MLYNTVLLLYNIETLFFMCVPTRVKNTAVNSSCNLSLRPSAAGAGGCLSLCAAFPSLTFSSNSCQGFCAGCDCKTLLCLFLPLQQAACELWLVRGRLHRVTLQIPRSARQRLPLIYCELLTLCHLTCADLFLRESSSRSDIGAANELAGSWVGANPR